MYAKEILKEYVALINLKPKYFLFLDSPMACELAINILKNIKFDKLTSQLKSQLDSQLDSQLAKLGLKLRRLITSSTLLRFSSLTVGNLLITRETVVMETPAALATS